MVEKAPVKSELFWVAPVALTTVGATLYLLLNRRWGADTAAILSLPLGVAGILVAILIDRGKFRQPLLRIPPDRTRIWRWASGLIAVVLAGTAALWWIQREPDPFGFLAGDVRIGYTIDGYSGWHTRSNGIDTGFDVAVAESLQRRFGFRIEWVLLDSLPDRLEALRGRWRDAKGNLQEPVKLVISNFSMTPERAEQVDFAGPYFVDRQGFLSKPKATTITQLRTDQPLCVLRGSTDADFLRLKGWPTVERPSLDACISDFQHNQVHAVSGDSTALAGYAKQKGIDPAQYISFADGGEEYGVGLPNNSPRLCAAVSDALDRFLTNEWAGAFAENLQPLGLHVTKGADDPAGLSRPTHTDSCQQPQPWNQG